MGIQQRLAPGVVLSASYLGTKGSYLQTVRNLNQPAPEGAAQVLAGAANVNQVRPFQGFGTIMLYDNGTNSNYNSFQFSLRSDNFRGLTLQTSYTWGTALTTPASTWEASGIKTATGSIWNARTRTTIAGTFSS